MNFAKMFGINISELVTEYIGKIGAGIAAENNVPVDNVTVTIYFKNGVPQIAYFVNNEFKKWLSAKEIESYCK